MEFRYEKPTAPHEIRTFVFNNSVTKMLHEESSYVSDDTEVGSMFEFVFRVDYEQKTCSIPKALYDDFQSYVSEAPDVKLVASDGQVETKMSLLKMRSKVLRTIFEMETSKEYQTKQVDMGDYSKKVLE